MIKLLIEWSTSLRFGFVSFIHERGMSVIFFGAFTHIKMFSVTMTHE